MNPQRVKQKRGGFFTEFSDRNQKLFYQQKITVLVKKIFTRLIIRVFKTC
ncbi:chromosomal replication initiation protein [Gimesia maris DSM 8797]|nr:chromosomal replication initiation protein [Gimesia maris DSM 8797]